MHITLLVVLDCLAVSKTKKCYPNNATPAVWRNKQKRGVTELVTPQILIRSKQRKEILEKKSRKLLFPIEKDGKVCYNK